MTSGFNIHRFSFFFLFCNQIASCVPLMGRYVEIVCRKVRVSIRTMLTTKNLNGQYLTAYISFDQPLIAPCRKTDLSQSIIFKTSSRRFIIIEKSPHFTCYEERVYKVTPIFEHLLGVTPHVELIRPIVKHTETIVGSLYHS